MISRFKTVKNSALTYKNWAQYQPDNLVMQYDVVDGKEQVAPLGEHWVAMAYSGEWADFGNHKTSYNNPIKYYAVFEFDTMPDCYTAAENSQEDQFEGIKCSTQIYDKDNNQTGGVGKLFDCQKDQFGTDFCPTQMAACAQEWDYIDGESQEVDTKLSTNPDCAGVMENGVCYEQVGDATKVTNLSCENRRFYSFDEVDFSFYINLSCSNNKATVKYYIYHGNQGRLIKTFTIISNDPNIFSPVWRYPAHHGDAAITCRKSGACSVYVVSYHSAHIFRIIRFSLNISTEYKCNDNQIVGNKAYQKADPTKCYNGYEPSCKGSLNKTTNKCELDYKYYKYLCKDDKNEYGLSYVPVNPGGDCNAENLLPDGTCNSSTPPSNNCKKEKNILVKNLQIENVLM